METQIDGMISVKYHSLLAFQLKGINPKELINRKKRKEKKKGFRSPVLAFLQKGAINIKGSGW